MYFIGQKTDDIFSQKMIFLEIIYLSCQGFKCSNIHRKIWLKIWLLLGQNKDDTH